MTDKILAKSDPSKLEQLLDNLEIVISQDAEDGTWTVCTSSEPLFCFVRSTQAELDAVVSDTLRSYLETFYDAVNVQVQTVSVPLEKSVIPVRELKPVSRLKPTITSGGHGEPQYAWA